MSNRIVAPGEVEAPSEDALRLMLSETEMPADDESLREDIAARIEGSTNGEGLRIRHILEDLRIKTVPSVLIDQLRSEGKMS